MKELRWILVVVLLGIAACLSAVPRMDLPETAFNEADAPVNLAPPIRPSTQFIHLAADRIAVLPTQSLHSAGYLVGKLVLEPVTTLSQCHPHSLQDLLCTLLI